jgi:ABC transporter substrate binding protein
MRRRAFIALLGGAAVAWPLAARGQQGERVRRIGVLVPTAADDPAGQRRVLAFAQALAQSGWTDGRNVRIDIRWGAADPERIRRYVAELVALAPDVILTVGSATTGPLLQATRAVPIVFVQVAEPVGAGFVEALARPGGNATGFMLYEYGIGGKWLDLLKEIAPGVKRVAFLPNPAIAAGPGQFGAMQASAPSLGVEVRPINVREPARSSAPNWSPDQPGPGRRRYFGGCLSDSSIRASPRFPSKMSPRLLLVPVRLAPCVSELAPRLEPARCAEVLARPLLLLAAGSCSTLQRRDVCRPPWPELALASAFVADFAPFPDPELHLPSSSFDLVPVEPLLGLLSSSLDLVPVEALPGLTV